MAAHVLGVLGHRTNPAYEWPLANKVRHALHPAGHSGHSQYHQGSDYVAGTTKVNGVLRRCAVFLHDHETGRLLARTFSGSDGAFRINWVAADRKYYAIAFDVLTNEKAEVFDLI